VSIFAIVFRMPAFFWEPSGASGTTFWVPTPW